MPTSSERSVILLVDDDPETSMLLRRLIQTFAPNCALESVTTAHAALAAIVVRPIALVITDYHMPGMNGVQLTRVIKQIAPTVRVAITTADDLRDVTHQAYGVAVDYVLPKPYIWAQLKQMIAESIPAAHLTDR